VCVCVCERERERERERETRKSKLRRNKPLIALQKFWATVARVSSFVLIATNFSRQNSRNSVPENVSKTKFELPRSRVLSELIQDGKEELRSSGTQG
jgi:hypothetical protein